MTLLFRSLGVGALVLSLGCQTILGIEGTTTGDVLDAGLDANTSGFSLTVSPNNLRVVRGQSIQLDVVVTRDAGFTGAVVISVEGLPTGVTFIGATSTDAVPNAEITVDAGNLSALGPADITVTGTAGNVSVPVATTLMVADPPGVLDETFDSDGILVISVPNGSDANVIVFDIDGEILVGSTETDDWVVRRIGQDGTELGKITLLNIVSPLRAMVVQPDGRILLAGEDRVGGVLNAGFNVIRLNSDLTVDETFGSSGRGLWTGNVSASANGIATTQGGRIVVSGSNAVGNGVGVVLAFTPLGGLDTAFSPDPNPDPGVTEFTTPVVFYDILVRSDGQFYLGLTDSDLAVLLLDADGSPNLSFGGQGNGIALMGSPGTLLDTTKSLALDPSDDGVYVGGYSTVMTASDDRVLLTKFNSNGAVDTSFGASGVVWEQLGGNKISQINDLAVYPGGVVAVGNSGDPGINLVEGFIARYTSNGSQDVTFFDSNGSRRFGVQGLVQYRFNAVAIDDDGRIVVVGNRKNDTFSDGIVVLRLWD